MESPVRALAVSWVVLRRVDARGGATAGEANVHDGQGNGTNGGGDEVADAAKHAAEEEKHCGDEAEEKEIAFVAGGGLPAFAHGGDGAQFGIDQVERRHGQAERDDDARNEQRGEAQNEGDGRQDAQAEVGEEAVAASEQSSEVRGLAAGDGEPEANQAHFEEGAHQEEDHVGRGPHDPILRGPWSHHARGEKGCRCQRGHQRNRGHEEVGAGQCEPFALESLPCQLDRFAHGPRLRALRNDGTAAIMQGNRLRRLIRIVIHEGILMRTASIVTRFAPSPTGDLHLGGAYVALASWWLARRGDELPLPSGATGRFVLRMEDIDTPRVVAGSAERIVADLAWLGLAWDEGPVAQSGRLHLYAAAIDALAARGLVYPCDCSRADIARVASAPHAGEETVYPGLCRDRDPARPMKRPPALRLRVPDEEIAFDDGVAGRFSQNLARDVGDFVLRRGDGVYAYQLVVVVDDLDMGMTDVVRGVDLLGSTPRQIVLARMLGADVPRYHHVPLVADAHGERLAKRTPGAHIRALQEAGVAREAILGELAHALGIAPSAQPCGLRELLDSKAPQLAPHAFRIPERWAPAAP